MSAKRYRASVQTVSGNFGQVPVISFDKRKSKWTIDLRPNGPPTNLVILGDEVVSDLVKQFNEVHGLSKTRGDK